MKNKLYLEPLGENGLPLHNIANIDNCMKSYRKVVGIFIDKEILSCFLEWCNIARSRMATNIIGISLLVVFCIFDLWKIL